MPPWKVPNNDNEAVGLDALDPWPIIKSRPTFLGRGGGNWLLAANRTILGDFVMVTADLIGLPPASVVADVVAIAITIITIVVISVA